MKERSPNHERAAQIIAVAVTLVPPSLAMATATGMLASQLNFETIKFRLDSDLLGMEFESRKHGVCHIGSHPGWNIPSTNTIHLYCQDGYRWP